MEIAAGLSWVAAVWNHGLAPFVEVMNFDASGGLANSIGLPVLSGLASLELLKLVTNDDVFEEWVPSFVADSLTTAGWLQFTESTPIRSCIAIEYGELR